MIILTTRFDNNTWKENIEYRKKHNIECIYPIPQKISDKYYLDCLVWVIEMNNSTNEIEGIGLIKNRAHMDKYYKVYSVGNYNRYVYKSVYYIDRETLKIYNNKLVPFLDNILFKGKTHLKRGVGMTAIPGKLLLKCEFNLLSELKEIFKNYFRNKGDNDNNDNNII